MLTVSAALATSGAGAGRVAVRRRLPARAVVWVAVAVVVLANVAAVAFGRNAGPAGAEPVAAGVPVPALDGPARGGAT